MKSKQEKIIKFFKQNILELFGLFIIILFLVCVVWEIITIWKILATKESKVSFREIKINENLYLKIKKEIKNLGKEVNFYPEKINDPFKLF